MQPTGVEAWREGGTAAWKEGWREVPVEGAGEGAATGLRRGRRPGGGGAGSGSAETRKRETCGTEGRRKKPRGEGQEERGERDGTQISRPTQLIRCQCYVFVLLPPALPPSLFPSLPDLPCSEV